MFLEADSRLLCQIFNRLKLYSSLQETTLSSTHSSKPPWHLFGLDLRAKVTPFPGCPLHASITTPLM